MFKDTYLPGFTVAPFAYALPYTEVTVGAVLVLGVLTRYALTFAGLLLLALSFGMMVKQDHTTVANNLGYVFIAAAALWLSARANCYSFDSLLRRKR